MTEVSTRRAGVGRADLLRAIALHEPARLALEHDGEVWFGFMRMADAKPDPVQPPPLDDLWDLPPPPVSSASENPFRLPLQMQSTLAVIERTQRQSEPTEDDSAAELPPSVSEPLTEGELCAVADTPQGELENLIPYARLMPALRRYLGGTRVGALDVDRLSTQIASGQFPQQLPRRRHACWHPSLVVVLDFSSRLWPYRRDLHRLARQLIRHCGTENVSIRIVERPESLSWFDWYVEQGLRRGSRAGVELPWTSLPSGTPVMIVGDLGLLLGAESPAYGQWHQFVRRLRLAQSQPLLLTPLDAAQIDAGTTRLLPVLGWGPEGRARLLRGQGTAQSSPPGLDDLLALVAATRRVDPPLLRAFRKLVPAASRHPGLEGAVWNHPDMDAGIVVQPSQAARDSLLARFAQLPVAMQLQQADLRERHHRHLRTLVNDEEALVWSSVADASALADPAARAKVDAAKGRIRRLALAGDPSVSRENNERLLALAAEIEARAEPTLWQCHGDVLTDLVAMRVSREQATGALPRIPPGVDPALLAARLNRDGALASVFANIVIDIPSGRVRIQAEPSRHGSQSHIGQFKMTSTGARFRLGDDASPWRWFVPQQLPLAIAPIDVDGALSVESANESVSIHHVQRPRGIAEWRRSETGIFAMSPDFCGKRLVWAGAHLAAMERRTSGEHSEYGFKYMEFGQDPYPYTIKANGLRYGFGLDEFGVYTEFEITTPHGSATQRLRWIEPGSFRMGSPVDEPGRFDDEGPQHEVTLSEGFWLADTACTQALWQAVTGKNPSRFKGAADLPVEQVSGNDVQQFLKQLESALPGMRVSLPSEGEWEHGCRAGTKTPFSFGDQITPAQVNYNGNHPYNGGAKGENRERTVPVKSFPPNAWGLYEMHGNVWEWCADGRREYDGRPQRDPFGPEGPDTPRALRGGSWISGGRDARSACRSANVPADTSILVGFRLSLRSIQPSPAVPGGPEVLRPEGDPEDAAPDRGGTRRSGALQESGGSKLLDKLTGWFRPGKPK